MSISMASNAKRLDHNEIENGYFPQYFAQRANANVGQFTGIDPATERHFILRDATGPPALAL
jgi:hypothetical protein